MFDVEESNGMGIVRSAASKWIFEWPSHEAMLNSEERSNGLKGKKKMKMEDGPTRCEIARYVPKLSLSPLPSSSGAWALFRVPRIDDDRGVRLWLVNHIHGYHDWTILTVRG